MGRPKHLIQRNGKTWLENIVEVLQQFTDKVVIAGKGKIPPELSGYPCVPDIPGVAGPLSGMLAAMRGAPNASWLVVACDMPDITVEAVKWLLMKRTPGVWGILPKLPGSTYAEPLFAYYDIRAVGILEKMVEHNNFSPFSIVTHNKIITPTIPSQLAGSWKNINTEIERRNNNNFKV